MPLIHVVKAFNFQVEEGRMQRFAPGAYEVDAATADHWFVQAHLAGYVTPPRQMAPNYQQAELEVMQAVRRNEPVAAQAPPVAPPPPGTETMTPVDPTPPIEDMRGWLDPSERKSHTFVGRPADALDGPAVSFLPSSAP
jgi:hypothetical protein